ncbi:HPP family protein [Aliarcobacter butzleri]|uniref:HPP family protein n=1 Tax=Aliarcobacter butzleri TaxID=28197 RepID=UPI00344D5B70
MYILFFSKSPFLQPRNVILGHSLSSLVELLFLHFIEDNFISMTLALATRIVHPPAGSNPIIIFLLSSSWDYLIFPTLVGSIILVLVSFKKIKVI